MTFKIWQPRWHDRSVLLSKYKIDKNSSPSISVVFTKTKSLPGIYNISKEEVLGCKVDGNGTIPCYVVPLSLFKVGVLC